MVGDGSGFAGAAPASTRSAGERPKRQRREPSNRPTIQIRAGELHTMADAAEAALIDAGLPIFQRGASLVRPITQEVAASGGRTTTAAAFAELTVPATLDYLCHVAAWEKYDGRAADWVPANPPKLVADVFLSRRGSWQVPIVAGVITTPTLRPDGSLLSATGYDPATRLYHAADPAITLHKATSNPTRAAAEAALDTLDSLLDGFPFVDLVSRAVALSALITPVVRGAIGFAPMHLFRAPTPGSGKSYLADVVSSIATGRPCPVTAAADPVETEKRLVGALLAGFPLVNLDNVNGEIGGDLLCQMIERPFVNLRRLGQSDSIEVENKATTLATGNNARVRGDMVRRTLVADLDAGMERPELREFASDPVATIMADRSRYVSAALIVVRAYILAGQPSKLIRIGSFMDWSDLVRSALVWLGCADPAKSMEQAREDDPELGELREVMTAWQGAFGGDAVTIMQGIDPTIMTMRPDLKDALLKVAGKGGMIDSRRLGYWLRGRVNRPVGGLCFKKGGEDRTGNATWMVGVPGR